MRRDQRHYIYKNAYRKFINNLMLGHTPLAEKRGIPLCHVLGSCCLLLNDKAKLEEFWRFAPYENKELSRTSYWTGNLTARESRAVRETILLFCIEMSS